MKSVLTIIAIFSTITSIAQPTITPAPSNSGTIYLENTTVHTGAGSVLHNATIVINEDKIQDIGKNIIIPTDTPKERIIDCTNKHTYPALIQSISTVGLMEVSAVRATRDYREVGEWNAGVQAFNAYNTDSEIINTVRDNGILLINIIPRGKVVAGKSSVMQLDGWNWEDALYAKNVGLHVYMPGIVDRSKLYEKEKKKSAKQYKQNLKTLEEIYAFFQQANAYCVNPHPKNKNLNFESMRNIFQRKEVVFFHANWVKEIIAALDIAQAFNLKAVIVGGYDSWRVAKQLREQNVSVILEATHSLPQLPGDPIDITFKTPYLLQKAGVLFAISADNNYDRGRNLAYNAGTAAAYGLTKEQALASITSNPAKILGIANRTGTIEIGKDANIIVSEGDILDMQSSHTVHAFIQGRKIKLDNLHKQLYRKYKTKYAIK